MLNSDNSKDYYEILGVSKDATDDDIRKAYFRLASKYHPDKVDKDQKQFAHEKFIKIGEAYSVLSDKTKRKEYDLRKQHGEFFTHFDGFHNFHYFDDMFKRHFQMFAKFFDTPFSDSFQNINITQTTPSQNTSNTQFIHVETMHVSNNGKSQGYKKEITNKNGVITEKTTRIDGTGKKTVEERTLPNDRTIKF